MKIEKKFWAENIIVSHNTYETDIPLNKMIGIGNELAEILYQDVKEFGYVISDIELGVCTVSPEDCTLGIYALCKNPGNITKELKKKKYKKI